MALPIKIQPGDDGRLTVVLSYTPERVEKIKTVPRRRWNAEQKHWTVPATTGMVGRLVSLFAGDNIQVDPALHRDEDVRTTQRYTHVSNRDVDKIRSPLDNLTPKEDAGVYEVIEVEAPF